MLIDSLLYLITSTCWIASGAPCAVNNILLNTDGFEGNQIANFWHPELWTPTAGAITNEQHRAGKQAMRFSWRSAQSDGTNKMLHAELADSPIPVNTIPERWYGYSAYMPSNSMANDSETVIISQWHGVPDPGGAHTVPAVAISLEPGNILQLIYRASFKPITTFLQPPTSQKTINLGAASFDRWVDYVVHITWDSISKNGQIQLWQDGMLLVNEHGISIGYQEQKKPYWKIGLYCWTGKSTYLEKVIYYDEVAIGGPNASYDVIKPGRSDISAKPQR